MSKPALRIALINEGTYPYATGGVSTWCDQLVRGIASASWHLVTIVGDAGVRPAMPLPDNVASLLPVGTTSVIGGRRLPTVRSMWRSASRAHRRRMHDAAQAMCRGMLGDGPEHAVMFEAALRELAERGCAGEHPLAGVPLADLLLDAWNDARLAAQTRLPRLTLHDAAMAALLLDHAMAPMAADAPEVDLCHANANGLSSLIALTWKWRHGYPYIMTEHGVYLRERYLASSDQAPGVKATMLRFHRALAQLAYRSADLVAPVSSFNSRWELRHGAHPARLQVVPNGVDPERFPALPAEPDEPTIAWVGRVDPLKDLHTLIRALGHARQQVPRARLHLAGPTPVGNEEYAESCERLAQELGLADAVTFAGPVKHSRDAFAHGQIVALSSISEGMPYTVIEAMMCGRATVNTDVGGVAETVGEVGVVVPPRDPVTFGAACGALLADPIERRALAKRARVRALEHYTLDKCVNAYQALYRDLVDR